MSKDGNNLSKLKSQNESKQACYLEKSKELL